MRVRPMILCCFASSLLLSALSLRAADDKMIVGADISMLPEIEKAGGVFLNAGKPADAIAIFKNHGFNLFRVRLFVNPSKDFNSNWGAIQGFETVRALAKRIKASGAMLLLDLHYSDTWADPGKQTKPAAWKDLSFEQLETKVYDYTATVLRDLKLDGIVPDMVQVGNEIAPGMLWPDGKLVYNTTPEDEEAHWARFAKLFDAGARAVRDASTPAQPIRVVIHIHGGGHEGLPPWFFNRFTRHTNNFDVIALSFYPGPKESFKDLKLNIDEVIKKYGKDVLIAEVAYPWKQAMDPQHENQTWPLTPQGQEQFVRDLMALVRGEPNGRAIGAVWWYPESIQVKGLQIWERGAKALFDDQGNPLPAMSAFGQSAPNDGKPVEAKAVEDSR
ncbi:MAG: glycosyl hydrolase 53 family protein [Anaerolineae bacterium]|nr:glycosyl hydrolase 53 family protein [Phycisphaerae bacterium]